MTFEIFISVFKTMTIFTMRMITIKLCTQRVKPFRYSKHFVYVATSLIKGVKYGERTEISHSSYVI